MGNAKSEKRLLRELDGVIIKFPFIRPVFN